MSKIELKPCPFFDGLRDPAAKNGVICFTCRKCGAEAKILCFGDDPNDDSAEFLEHLKQLERSQITLEEFKRLKRKYPDEC